MNKIYFCSLVLFLFFSCSKQKEGHYSYPEFILTGQIDGEGIKYYEPNDTICAHVCSPWIVIEVDLNHDAIADFDFRYEMSDPYLLSSGHVKFEIIPKKNNSVCVSKFNNSWVDTLRFNDTIGINNIWSDSAALFESYSWAHIGYKDVEGLWFNANRYYIGFKIDMVDYQLYGWIKEEGLIVKKYAITAPFEKQILVSD
jgi:hypothetical protein